jgi:N-hydroxyarylamine O-acetyltransferase|eukprot:gene7929-8569_t
MWVVSNKEFIPDLPRLFEKIKYECDLQTFQPTLFNLRSIHEKFLLSFPFENFNLHLREVDITDRNQCKVDIAPEELEKKLLIDNRGGYCFELNQYLHYVLRSLGYHVTPIQARVRWMKPPSIQTPRTHLVNVVTFMAEKDKPLHDQYLCDVAFGTAGFVHPLCINDHMIGKEQSTIYDTHRVIPYALSSEEEKFLPLDNSKGHFIVQTLLYNGSWETNYLFHKSEFSTYADWYCGNWFVATSPDSVFVKNLILNKVLEDGKITLFNNCLTRRIIKKTNESHIQTEVLNREVSKEEFFEILAKDFQINVTQSFRDNLHIPLLD